MCCNASIDEIFTWFGAFLAHVGFISIICYGAVNLWPLGMVLCGLYTAFLFAVARQSEPTTSSFHETESTTDDHSRGGNYSLLPPQTDTTEDVEENQGQQLHQDRGQRVEEIAHNDETLPSSIGPSLLCNLVYALAVIGIGATGSFLPVNLLVCSNTDDHYPSPKPEQLPEWRLRNDTHATIPPDVLSWIQSPDQNAVSNIQQTWVYIPDLNTTLFSGRNSDFKQDRLFESCPGKSPIALDMAGFSSPSLLTSVNRQSACFVTSYLEQSVLKCFVAGNYTVVDDGTDPQELDENSRLLCTQLYVSNSDQELLWYKSIAFTNPVTLGQKIQSYNVSSNKRKSYSTLFRPNTTDVVPDHSSDECTYETENRRIAFGNFVAAGIPMLITSWVIWKLRSIPSMGFMTLASLDVLFFTFSNSLMDPSKVLDQWGWWHLLVGMTSLLLLSYSNLLQQTGRRGLPSRWGLEAASLMYGVGVFGIKSFGYNDRLSDWMTFNILLIPVLLFFGMVNNLSLSYFVIGLAWMMDAFRLSDYIVESVSHREDLTFLINFFIFALFGSILALLGAFLKHYSEVVRYNVQASVQTILGVNENLLFSPEADGTLPVAEMQENLLSTREENPSNDE